MRATVSQQHLASGVSMVTPLAPTSADLLSNVLFEPNAGGFADLTTSDSTTWVRTRIPAAVLDATPRLLHAKTLSNVTSRLSPVDVEITGEGDQVQIRAGRSRFKLNSLTADDFPRPQAMVWTGALELSGALLADLLGAVEHTVSTEDTRPPALRNVLWIQEGRVLTLVSLDGHRMAVAT